eukprot:TRINITY_DN76175_c0_g1_i1.p1 TRINITY_DN76175_c0_g1~~TRINITY_DN76175_c0_g1_i1.p1  ORF type:complete len:604 (+),score=25.11 TRINITY_DN76175_c0_g1_i1:25-1836(+)
MRSKRGVVYLIIICGCFSLIPIISMQNKHQHPRKHPLARTSHKPRPTGSSTSHTSSQSSSILNKLVVNSSTSLTELYSSLSLRQKIGQLLMMSVPGPDLTEEDKQVLGQVMPGGIILCPYNVDAQHSVVQLTQKLQRTTTSHTPIPLFISIDQEGGRFLRDPLSENQHVTRFPSQMAFGVINKPEYAYQWGLHLGKQLRNVGVNMNLSPVLDVNNNPNNPIINMRSFGSNPRLVQQLGDAYVKGLQDANCIAVGKHFPGHGDTAQDSHTVLPTINHTMAKLEEVEMKPFRSAIKAGLAALMCAHIAYPVISHDYKPATLSHFFLTELLRNSMKFEGITLTDDMKMDAIKMTPAEGAVASIKAGGDIVLSTVSLRAAQQMANALERAALSGELPEDRIRQSVMRILRIKQRFGILDAKADPTAKLDGTTLVEEAKQLNELVSSQSLIYSGKQMLLNPPAETIRIFLIGNELLRGYIKLDNNDMMFHGARSFFARASDMATLIKDTKPKTESVPPVVVYHYSYFYTWEIVQQLREKSKQLGFPIVTLLSGSPYQINEYSVPYWDAALISFGNNPRSLIAIAGALKGDIKPRKGAAHINLNLPYSA